MTGFLTGYVVAAGVGLAAIRAEGVAAFDGRSLERL
jgi:hypothetical protein